MILRILRYLSGYVRFEIISRFPERFLNITSKRSLRVWGAKREGARLYACMYMKDYLSIRPVARAASARLKITQKKGVPVILRAHRGRVGLLFGAAAFLLVIFVMSQFILSIEITGADRVSVSELKEELREEGLYVGAFKPALDYDMIARNMLIKDKDLGWMAVNVSGSYASVELKEESLPPPVEDISTPCNIKASRDGVIVSSNIAQGASMIEKGSGVIKDQLLVSGVIEDAAGGVSFVHASAEVIAKTVREMTFSLDKDRSSLEPLSASVSRYRAGIFSLSVPLSFSNAGGEYAAVRSEERGMRLLDTDIPLSVIREDVYSFDLCEKRFSEKEARTFLERQSLLYEAFALCDCTVEEREYDFSYDEERCYLKVTYHCLEDIACQNPIIIQKDEEE